MSATHNLSFDRILELLAEKLAERLCEEPGRLYEALLTFRNAAQMHIDGGQCVALEFALSPCAKCGRAITGAIHSSKLFGGLYCAGCCPSCATGTQADGGSHATA